MSHIAAGAGNDYIEGAAERLCPPFRTPLPMRTSLAYAVSVGLHGVAFGALAYAAAHPDVLTVGFAVRAGDANGAMSQGRRARHIEARFDTAMAEKPAAPVIVPSTDPEPKPTSPSRPAEPATAANLDTQPTKPSA